MKSSTSNIFFIHIPKTGGTSFERILAENYHEQEILSTINEISFFDNSHLDLNQYRVFWGHRSYFIRDILPPDIHVCTFLRDPLARSLSAYEHILRDTAHASHQLLISTCNSPKDILKDKRLSDHFDNPQTRMLGRKFDFKGLLEKYINGECGKKGAAVILQRVRSAQATREELETAKSRLSSIITGITEEFEASCLRISRRLGLTTTKIPRENVAPPNSIARISCYSEDDIETFRLINDFDYELYEYARQLWNKQDD